MQVEKLSKNVLNLLEASESYQDNQDYRGQNLRENEKCLNEIITWYHIFLSWHLLIPKQGSAWRLRK